MIEAQERLLKRSWKGGGNSLRVQTRYKLEENRPASYIGVLDGTYLAALFAKEAKELEDTHLCRAGSTSNELAAELYNLAGDATKSAAMKSVSPEIRDSHLKDADEYYKAARRAWNKR